MSKIFLPNLISNTVLSSDNLYRQGGRGLVCVFSLKNPAHPEYVCEAKSGVMCLDFHSNHPHMLVAGLYDGNVAVYNLQSSLTRPPPLTSAHTEKLRETGRPSGGSTRTTRATPRTTTSPPRTRTSSPVSTTMKLISCKRSSRPVKLTLTAKQRK